MGSERVIRAAAAQGGVLLAGAAAAAAASHGLYASALTAALAGLWLAAAGVEGASSPRVRIGRGGPDAPAMATPLLRALLNEAPAPLLLLERGGTVRAVNRAARALFATDDRLMNPPPRLVRAMREDAAGGRRRLALAGAAGPRRLYALSLADVGGADATLRLGALLDVQAEVHAAEADTLRSVLQVMSHELMNALTPITSLAESAADMLSEEPGSPAALAAREALRTIGRRADGLSRFLEGYRAAARLPEPRPRSVDVAELARDAVGLARARPDAAGVRVVLHGAQTPLLRVTDPELVAQALANLLANAVEAAARSDGGEVVVTLVPSPAGATLSVADDGPGVPAAEAASIFLPLTTSKPQGAGVGLHLARSALRSLGGDVVLVARSGAEPTRFELTL